MEKIVLNGTIELIISLIISGVLVLKFRDSIKKNRKYWFIGSWILSVLSMMVATMVFLEVFEVEFSAWWVRMIRGIISGYLPATMFMFVMYGGAFTSYDHTAKKALISIRTELSIMAVIFYLPHTILYTAFSAPYGIMALLSGKIQLGQQIMTWTGIINSILLIVLGITSTKKMRERLKMKRWKKLHKWSYLFYFNCFAHYMTLSIWGGHYERSVIYVLIYGTYLILKLRKEVFYKRPVVKAQSESL